MGDKRFFYNLKGLVDAEGNSRWLEFKFTDEEEGLFGAWSCIYKIDWNYNESELLEVYNLGRIENAGSLKIRWTDNLGQLCEQSIILNLNIRKLGDNTTLWLTGCCQLIRGSARCGHDGYAFYIDHKNMTEWKCRLCALNDLEDAAKLFDEFPESHGIGDVDFITNGGNSLFLNEGNRRSNWGAKKKKRKGKKQIKQEDLEARRRLRKAAEMLDEDPTELLG